MLSLFTIGALAGALLGLRYKALALLPAIFTASFTILLSSALSDGKLNIVGPALLFVTIALQIGYICGLTLRHMSALARVARFRRSASISASTSPTIQ